MMTGVMRGELSGPAVQLAPRLLGCLLTSEVGGATVSVRLTEVEAYEGADDPASHAFLGRTPRTEVMFGPPGYLYCYFTYGMHWCANVVCGEDGLAAAVLVRAGEVVVGQDIAFARRPAAKRAADLARGPARLAACLGLGREHDGVDLCTATSPVRLGPLTSSATPDGPPTLVRSGPRVGISAAAERPWRFWLDGESSVSTYRAGGRRSRSPRPAD